MKIATFNIENLFHRDESLVRKTLTHSVTSWMLELENLLHKNSRESGDFLRMRELSFLLGFHKSAFEPYVVMRRKAGNLYLRQRNATLDYKASELSNWDGWIKLNTLPINEIVIRNKARVIAEVNPDILVLQEVEDRQSLVEFNQYFLPDHVKFTDIMIIPGNDTRGLDMGIMTKNGYRIKSVKSQVNDFHEGRKCFDKDCQEYEILSPDGHTIWILSAHLQEQGQNKGKSDNQRRLQAQLMAELYRNTRERGGRNVVVTGTLNAPSYCDSLLPLIAETDLVDLKNHPSFNVDLDVGKDAGYFSLGAYRRGVNTKQRDYLMLSPELFKAISNSGLNRKAVWPKRKAQYSVYSSVQSEYQQASSHALVWVEI